MPTRQPGDLNGLLDLAWFCFISKISRTKQRFLVVKADDFEPVKDGGEVPIRAISCK